jgi:DNA-binding NarL/FixJ family response regulator
MMLSAIPSQAGATDTYLGKNSGLAPQALAAVYPRYGRRGPAADPLQRLTGRQREVLALIAEGLSNAAIARLLSITERAVVRHISNIYDQLDLPISDDEHRRVRAVLCYISRGPRCPFSGRLSSQRRRDGSDVAMSGAASGAPPAGDAA